MNAPSQREILVVGATGLQGGAVTKALRERGYPVRALCRNPESDKARALAESGVRIHKGDLEDPSSLVSAIEGVYGVFGVQNFWDGLPTKTLGADGELRQGKNLLDAARGAGVRHFVQSTGAGVTVAPEIEVNRGKLAIERYAREICIPCTVVRPLFFMENFNNPAWGMRDSLLDGELDLPFLPHTRLQMLAAQDLGHFVAMAFDRPDEFIGCNFDLASDEMTMSEITNTFTRVTGRPVEFTGSPDGLDTLAQVMPELAAVFRFEIFERGFRAFIPALRALHPELIRLEQFLQHTGWVS